ncbi:urocanate hydratase, partial [Enterococcus casseliflavus]
RALSVGLEGNAAEVFDQLLGLGFEADIVNDQTSAHDPLGGYVPDRMSAAGADALRESDPEAYIERSRRAMAAHYAAMVGFLDRGA